VDGGKAALTAVELLATVLPQSMATLMTGLAALPPRA